MLSTIVSMGSVFQASWSALGESEIIRDNPKRKFMIRIMQQLSTPNPGESVYFARYITYIQPDPLFHAVQISLILR